MSSTLQILDEQVASYELKLFGFENDLITLLTQLGIFTIGDVYALQAEGIAILTGWDFETAQALWDRILYIVAKPEVWPSSKHQSNEPILFSLLENIKPLIDEILAQFEPRIHTIIIRRFGLKDGKKYTLEDLGSYLEVTRERIRQLQVRGLRSFRDQLLGEVPTFFSEPKFDAFRSELLIIRQIIEEDLEPIRSENDLIAILESRYGRRIVPEQIPYLNLIFTTFGWKEGIKHQSVDVLTHWIVKPASAETNKVWTALPKLVNLLKQKSLRVSYFELKIELNRHVKLSDLTIRSAIKICAEIEQLGNDEFQIRFERLRGAPDQAYRVLSEFGQQSTVREIHREISRRLAVEGEKIPNLRTVGNALVSDDRFIAIGKSAWALAEWDDVVQNTIVELMVQFFQAENRPARTTEVYEYVKSRRPVKPNSITTYLVDRPEFRRVAAGLYQLSAWPYDRNKSVPATQKRTAAQIAECIVSIFDKHNMTELPASTLMSELKRELNISNYPYVLLHTSPAVKLTVISERPRRLKATLIRDYQAVKPPTLRTQVETAVREALKKQIDGTMSLPSLKERITKRGNIKPHTFYQYLSEMADLQKHVLDRTVYVTLTESVGYKDNDTNVPDEWDHSFVYDIAISYAGAQRSYAFSLAEQLRGLNQRVFYDRNQLPDLIGRNLLDELLLIYRDKARLCVILASNAYNLSPYAQHERQSAQDRALHEPGYIFLVNLDGVSPINGFHSTVAYVSWDEYGLEKIAALAQEQLARLSKNSIGTNK